MVRTCSIVFIQQYIESQQCIEGQQCIAKPRQAKHATGFVMKTPHWVCHAEFPRSFFSTTYDPRID
ncbi:MAG TPA: hypothetical protein DEB39_07890 [Planctomycetaceae bacterium]|nr:hypothetical protein [Planctomycetaceae bacterium]